MKRALAMALGAMMVAGTAAQADAASHIDFSGYYRVNYTVHNNPTFTNESGSFTDHYFDDRIQVNLTFRPTDEIAVYWGLRGTQRGRWGDGGRGDSMQTRYVYGEIVQDWGNLYIGRLTDAYDMFGLASLGYQPGFSAHMVNTGPFDGAGFNDGIRYYNAWDNGFSLVAQYNKMSTDWDAGSAWADSDNDGDRFLVEGAYQWDTGGVSLGVIYQRDAANHFFTDPDWSIPYPGGDPYYGNEKVDAFFVNPAFMQAWGNFSIHFEGMAGWGTFENTHQKNGKWRDTDADGYGAYLDFDYNYGPGNINLAGWWVSGSDLGDSDMGGLVDIVGGNFYPLMAAYGNMGSGNSRYEANGSSGMTAIGKANDGYLNFIAANEFQVGGAFLNDSRTNAGTAYANILNRLNISATNPSSTRTTFDNGEANHWGIAFTGNHAFNDDISMYYGIGYVALNNPNYAVVDRVTTTNFSTMANTTVGYKEQDKDLGFEIDLAFNFQLLDNLSFQTGFGYMFTGDAYKELRGYNLNYVTDDTLGAGGTAKAKYRDGDDTYVWYNTLQFDF